MPIEQLMVLVYAKQDMTVRIALHTVVNVTVNERHVTDQVAHTATTVFIELILTNTCPVYVLNTTKGKIVLRTMAHAIQYAPHVMDQMHVTVWNVWSTPVSMRVVHVAVKNIGMVLIVRVILETVIITV